MEVAELKANGLKGDQGPAATVRVGTVTTGAAGSSASVTNSGTENAAIFDFVIPRGNTGTSEFSMDSTLAYSTPEDDADPESGNTFAVWAGRVAKRIIGIADSIIARISAGWVEGTVALADGWTKNQTNYLVKNEALGLVYLSLSLKGTLSENTHVVVATIPSGYRPPHVIYTEGAGGATGPVQIQISSTSGGIDVWGASAGVDARFTVMYPLAKEV